jgi:AraC-like DNA-binding protein
MFPGGPVRFAQAQASIAFDARYLALPLRRDERALRAMLQRALPLTVLQYRRDRLLAQRVRERLREQPALTAAALARVLHLSVRTLHRQLHDEGAPLQALKDEVRRELALAALARSARPLKQVALDAGFRSEKSFARAFRQWTGQTPGGYRRAAAG